MSISIGVEDIYGGPCVFFLGIFGVVALGVPSVVALGVLGKVAFWVPGDIAHGIPGVVASMFPGVVYLGSIIYVPSKFLFCDYC